MPEKAEFKTCDMYLAASLAASGCKLSKYTSEFGRVYFHIDGKSGDIPTLTKEYLARRLTVDALTLVDNVKSLKSLCGELTGAGR